VAGCCEQSNADLGSINCAVFFEKVWRYELFKTDSAPLISLVTALSLSINPSEPNYYFIYRQVWHCNLRSACSEHEPTTTKAGFHFYKQIWTQYTSSRPYCNFFFVIDFHKTIWCVYTPKHTWFYFPFNSVLREKVDLMHRLIVLLYFR
jgi:hypothetical protein